MSDGMKKIQPLDSLGKEEFFRPASRLIEAQNKQYRSYHERPIQRDMFADYDAIAAWSTVTCCYSGIEQSMKCLLEMRGIIDRKTHWLGKLFRKLAPEEQHVLRFSYAIYRSLHNYILRNYYYLGLSLSWLESRNSRSAKLVSQIIAEEVSMDAIDGFVEQGSVDLQ